MLRSQMQQVHGRQIWAASVSAKRAKRAKERPDFGCRGNFWAYLPSTAESFVTPPAAWFFASTTPLFASSPPIHTTAAFQVDRRCWEGQWHEQAL